MSSAKLSPQFRLQYFIAVIAAVILLTGCITYTTRVVSLTSVNEISKKDELALLSIVESIAKTNQLSLEQVSYPNLLRSYKHISSPYIIGSTLVLEIAVKVDLGAGKLIISIGNEGRSNDAKRLQASLFKTLSEQFGPSRVTKMTITRPDPGWLD